MTGFGELQLFGQVCFQEEGSSSWAGSTHVRDAGYLLVCKLSKVRMRGFVSPRSWLKLQYKPTWKGKINPMLWSLFLFQPPMTTNLPTREMLPTSSDTQTENPQWKNMGSVGGSWMCTLPLDSALSTQLHSIKLSWEHIDLSFCSALECGILEIQGKWDYTDPKHLLSPGHPLGILST